ncbi:MAG TPA: YolD-like family protein [Halanaerobiales bacterium]|nr:YolD-like family protein [Halanaerobiales bacterium]
MIKDRGNIKWTSLMLTEHREKLRELFNRDNEQKKPELDEQKKEELDFIIQMAVKQNLPIIIYYFEDRKEQKIRGVIRKYVSLKDLLVISDDKKDKYLNIHSIIDLKISF